MRKILICKIIYKAVVHWIQNYNTLFYCFELKRKVFQKNNLFHLKQGMNQM